MRLTRRTALIAPLALSACTNQQPASLAFREANEHLLAPIVAGSRQTLALIDNGAPMTSLDQRFADQARLARPAVGAGLQPLDIALGESALRIHPFVEDMTEAAIAADAPVGAIVGMELFNAFVVDFSFTRQTLTLHPRRGYRPPADAAVLATDKGPLPHPRVSLTLEGVEAGAFIDLGCSAAVAISSALAQRLGLADGRPSSTRQVILSHAEGLGLGVSRLTSLKSVRFAGRTFQDVPVDVLPADARAFAGLDAVIGTPLLRKFDLAFDLPRRLILQPNARIAQPFERRMTGIQTKPTPAGLMVRHVASGSPAEAAGFKAGEIIAAIDGAPPLMRTLRNAPAGQGLSLRMGDGSVRFLTGARFY